MLYIALLPLAFYVYFFKGLWLTHPIPCFRYLLSWWPALLAKLATFLLAPIVAPVSVFAKWENLPPWLYWMQTHDDYLTPKYFLSTDWSPWEFPMNKWEEIWIRMRWLWRNPAYSFMHDVLGVKGQEFETIAGGTYYDRAEKTVQVQVADNAISVRGIIFWRVELWAGWKLVRRDRDGKRMLAMGIKLID